MAFVIAQQTHSNSFGGLNCTFPLFEITIDVIYEFDRSEMCVWKNDNQTTKHDSPTPVVRVNE